MLLPPYARNLVAQIHLLYKWRSDLAHAPKGKPPPPLVEFILCTCGNLASATHKPAALCLPNHATPYFAPVASCARAASSCARLAAKICCRRTLPTKTLAP